MITACSYPIYEPLEIWVNQVNAAHVPITKPNMQTSVASSTYDASRNKVNSSTRLPKLDGILSSAPHAQTRFFESLQRDLRSSITKVKLYLDDARTVKVLLEHVVGMIEVMYERFGDAMFSVKQAGVGSEEKEQVEVISSSGLREILREVCKDSSLSFRS